jgi:poly-D-alanine transfer protein DltD
VLGNQGIKKKNWSWCFVEKRIKKQLLSTPLLSLSLFVPFFSSTTISSMNNFNPQVILENQTMINM